MVRVTVHLKVMHQPEVISILSRVPPCGTRLSNHSIRSTDRCHHCGNDLNRIPCGSPPVDAEESARRAIPVIEQRRPISRLYSGAGFRKQLREFPRWLPSSFKTPYLHRMKRWLHTTLATLSIRLRNAVGNGWRQFSDRILRS